MFEDLLNPEIQPEIKDIESIPEIKISQDLREKLQEMFITAEKGYVKVNETTAVVQTDAKYVFFSNQWLYLAVELKRYAEALIPYCNFFDHKIRTNTEIIHAFGNGTLEESGFYKLFENEDDIEKMLRFITGGNDFRPGKNLINNGKSRSCKDVFAFAVLRKIPVPDASSAYLGNIVYYLANNKDVFDLLEKEVNAQKTEIKERIRLSSVTKQCAREIVDCIYKLDSFESISALFEVNKKSIKINTYDQDDILPRGNFLRYIFARENSGLFNENPSGKTRVFTDREYIINVADESIVCRLTTEWVDSDPKEGGTWNYLYALIAIVNKYYSNYLQIYEESGRYYLSLKQNGFKIRDLPETLKSDYAKRFITSLLAKPFVILTGNSGTGKTHIALQFTKYLERTADDGKTNCAFIPVGADWTDNTKMLGFFNPLADDGKGQYVKTGILELIESAHRNKDIPYFLILDEMNLSHVERYFSDFLSHMETEKGKFVLDGYQYEFEGETVDYLPYPDNLFVIGTVNIDETTYMFSPKVLDRANVIEFKPEMEDILSGFSGDGENERIFPANDGSAEAFLKLALEIRDGERIFKERSDLIKEKFGTLYRYLEESGFEFAYRAVREIRQYLAAACAVSDQEEDFDLTSAVDEQVFQKILPKIHGNRKEIGSLLDNLERFCRQESGNAGEDYIYRLSGKKIEQMKGRLDTVQYASFI